MSNEEINKYLTEAMGECWHEWQAISKPVHGYRYCCTKCEKMVDKKLQNLTNGNLWIAFGITWGWATKQEWWGKFTSTFTIDGIQTPWIPKGIINPTNFTKAIYEFLKER